MTLKLSKIVCWRTSVAYYLFYLYGAKHSPPESGAWGPFGWNPGGPPIGGLLLHFWVFNRDYRHLRSHETKKALFRPIYFFLKILSALVRCPGVVKNACDAQVVHHQNGRFFMKKWKSQNRSRIDQGVFKYIQDITGTHLDIKKALIPGNQRNRISSCERPSPESRTP